LGNLHLNIVSFNVPWPPDYGGVIDVFFKIKALHAAGVKIHLHCFEYGRGKSDVLDNLCEEVHYYPRSAMWKGLLSDKPFIVQSRDNPALLLNLKKNSYPILFEGLHCCYFLNDEALRFRNKLLRMHNNEAVYYLNLGKTERKFFKQLYFFAEYRRLMKFERILAFANQVLCISKTETNFYGKRFRNSNYLAAFHGNEVVSAKSGKGDFVLYHGNLEVNENKFAALYIVNEVFSSLQIPLIIVGNNPDAALIAAVAKYDHIQLIANPEQEKMQSLIEAAHINYLPTFQNTGIKLKLLNALFRGRFCLVNSMMVDDTGLAETCIVQDDLLSVQQKIQALMLINFTAQDVLNRKAYMASFSDITEVNKLIRLLESPAQ